MKKQPPTEEEKEWILDDAFSSVRIDQTLKKIGDGSWTRRDLNKFLKEDQKFREEYAQALIDACQFLENDVLNFHKDKRLTPKAALAAARNTMEILKARKPEKYGNKLDVNMNQTVSIRANLEKANDRLKEIMRDVTPDAAAQIVTAVITQKKK